MIQINEQDIDKIAAVFYSILKGKKPEPIELPQEYPDNEIQQAVGYINKFIAEYNEMTDFAYYLGRGELNVELPKGKLVIIQSFKSLHASLKNLTWITQQIAAGNFNQRVNFMGEFSEAFNSMTQQLQISFQERKKSNEDLQEQVREMDRARKAMLNILEDLEKARLEADSATRAKSDFLARMSHEIRTPMNALIGLSHLALQTELTPKQQDYLNKIQFSSHNLLGIINDILDFSKIEAGKMDIEFIDFSLEDVLNNLSNLLTIKAQDKGIELLFAIDKNVPNYLVGDPLRLGQILINLGNNALKFTEKGEIVVRGKVVREYDGKVELEFAVSDSGIGIPEDKISKLFQEFSQVDGSTTRKYGGTGLGLAICKRLSEMMGGKIWIESEQGKGSTFRFTVVFGKQSEQKEKSYKPTIDLQGMKVLVVDDNQDARDVFTSYLNGFSFNVTSVSSGSAAIHELERTSSLPGAAPYQLVMMDWSMPGMDGIETAVRIKDDYKIKQKPKIIMATAFGREEVIKSAEKAGLDGFLIKPVSQSLLFDTIMSVFGKEVQLVSQPGRQKTDYTIKLSQIRGATILLVEDNEINQQVASELLEKESFVISIANNGKEAIESVKNWDYDLVLMDIQMPEMDGITATKEIRKNPIFKELPIIAMTAHAMVGDHEKSIEAGMNDHVTKPIDPDQLFATLVKWIKPGKRDFVPVESVPSGEEEDVVIPDVIPGIDIETAMKRVAGNKTLFRKLLLKFRENNQTVVDDIKNALKKNDMELARRLAHTVKGVSGNIAATDLYHKATELDAAIKERKAADFESLIQSFSDSLDFVLQSIAALEESSVENILPEGAEISIDIPTVSSSLTKLKELLEEDVTEAENMLASLKKQLIAPEHKELLKKLSKQIEEYDSDSASETINEIIKKINIE